MQRLMKIALFILTGYIHAEMLPENGANLNYTQVFFRWNQIPEAASYQFTIHNMGTGEESQLNLSKNSALLTDFMDWNSTYTWFICGLYADGSTSFCSEIYSFDIIQLPDYFPNSINISSYDESLSQDGVTIMDFESLDFSGSLDRNGTPIWFVESVGMAQNFKFTQFLENGNGNTT